MRKNDIKTKLAEGKICLAGGLRSGIPPYQSSWVRWISIDSDRLDMGR